jgi:hypothetical protein
MFPDSSIAQGFSCGDSKASYLCNFGLAPYFSEELKKRASSSTNYVLLFDESLNKEIQEKQMDVYVRFWQNGSVETRYYDSQFLGHATAEIVCKELDTYVTSLGHAKLLQLSMDGPNVNLKVEKLLRADIAKQTTKKMLDIGTCGLHTLHNAFRAGCAATGWDIELFLTSCYHLFHDSPARREDFLKVACATRFPLKFCCHR